MVRLFRKFAELILALRWPVLLVLALLTLIHTLKLTGLKIDPTVDMMLAKSSPEYLDYKAYRKKYGSDEVILAAMAAPRGIFEEGTLGALERVTRAVQAMPQVESVLSLASVSDLRHKFFGVKLVPALEGIAQGERSAEEAEAEIVANDLYRNTLISPDAKTANLVIRVKQGRERENGELLEALQKLFKGEEKNGVRFYMAGAPVEQYEFVRLIRDDQFRFVPMITLFLIAATFLIYRSLPCVALSIGTVFMTLAWTFGTLAFTGEDLNLVTSLLAPVLMIITVVNSIHYMNLFFDVREHQPSLSKAVVLTMEQLGTPCLLTHLTTLLGFLSLSLTSIPAIRSFGLFAALGTFYSFVLALVLTPVFLLILPFKKSERLPGALAHFFNRMLVSFLEKLEHRWKTVILAAVIAAAACSAWGLRLIQVDTNIVKQMKPDTPLAIATRYIDEHIMGVYTLGFVLTTREGRTVDDPELLKRIDGFRAYLESMPEITGVNSITTLIKRIHAVRKQDPAQNVIPEAEELRHYFKGIQESGGREAAALISQDLREVRLEAQMKAVGTQEGADVEKRAREYARENLESHFEILITGNVVLLGRMAENLVNSQMRSFGFAFLSIFIVIALIFRSLHLGLLAAIPNLLPILMVYGLMGYLGIELSTSTAMISSIVLGLVVDSSIHFLHRFRLEFERRGHYLQALHHTYRHTGQSLVISALILASGFSTSVFAGFRPTVQFGVLTGLTIFLSMICTLVALPVWVVMTRPFGRSKLFRRGAQSPGPIR